MSILDGRRRITEALEKMGRGKAKVQYRLRDWLLSRQRYWGAPIPIVYAPEGKPHPVPEKHLPWLLPTDVAFKPTGKSPLFYSKEFRERTEKIFGKGWTPEFDTMDTFVCSSFYYLRYLAEGNPQRFVDPLRERTWLPVSCYIGGPEHACMHLIYARFVMMALKDFGFVSHEEPFKKLVHQGLVTHKGAKMSKSKGNVVSPDSFIERYGSDVFRMYLMFMGPFTEGGDWGEGGILGISRFVQRLFALVTRRLNKKCVQSEEALSALHATIKKVSEDILHFRFNTALAALMELLNLLEKETAVSSETAQTIALLIAPLAPHLAEELWRSSGGTGFVVTQPWPTFDASKIFVRSLTIAVQVNGKVRAQLEVPPGTSDADILALAKAHPNVQKYIEGKTLTKEIVIPEKLISLVVP